MADYRKNLLTPSVPQWCTGYVMPLINTLYTILTFLAHHDFEGWSQIIDTPNVNLFGLWDPCYLGDWWLLVAGLPYMHPRFFYCSFACNFPPFCFCHVVRRCEASLAILEKMSARRPRFPAEEVLERIWNDSGDKEDLDSGETSESEVESSELASEDESDESVQSFSLNEGDNVQDSEQNSGDEVSDGGDGGNRVDCVRQRPARRQQQAPLVWRMAHEAIPPGIPLTGNPGVQVQTVGFEPYDYFALFINDDLLNCFITESNHYANDFIAEGILRRRSRANDWFPTNKKERKEFLALLFSMGTHIYTCIGPRTPCSLPPFSTLSWAEILFSYFSNFYISMTILTCLHLMIHILINCSSCDKANLYCWLQ